jgi:hypothetical protein
MAPCRGQRTSVRTRGSTGEAHSHRRSFFAAASSQGNVSPHHCPVASSSAPCIAQRIIIAPRRSYLSVVYKGCGTTPGSPNPHTHDPVPCLLCSREPTVLWTRSTALARLSISAAECRALASSQRRWRRSNKCLSVGLLYPLRTYLRAYTPLIPETRLTVLHP